MQPSSRHLVVTSWIMAAFLTLPLLSTPAWSADDVQGACSPGPTTLCLLGNRFSVEIQWEDSSAQTGDGQVFSFTSDDTGFFSFTDPTRIDSYVRIVDGTQLNGFFWVFFASLTNFEYTLTVTDYVSTAKAIYVNPLGSFTSLNDTMAIEDIPLPVTTALRKSTIGRPLVKESWDLADSPEKGAGGSCVPNSNVLCLDQGRFRVEVDWNTGVTGSGVAVPLTDSSGAYWFFTPSNIELAVKIYDGGDGFFWLFSGATTEVEYTLTVTDTCAGTVNNYFNTSGNLTSFGDFEAFDTNIDCGIFIDGFETGDVSQWSSAVGN